MLIGRAARRQAREAICFARALSYGLTGIERKTIIEGAAGWEKTTQIDDAPHPWFSQRLSEDRG